MPLGALHGCPTSTGRSSAAARTARTTSSASLGLSVRQLISDAELDWRTEPRLMARLIPTAMLRVIPGGGHLFLIDEPETVIDEIHAFLDQ
jgi:pimeloyl-ACP methyl ester carboxylesterase